MESWDRELNELPQCDLDKEEIAELEVGYGHEELER